MNIQIFQVSKSFDCRKAERWFKERRIPFQSVDLNRTWLSGREFDSVVRAVGGIDNLINWNLDSEVVDLLRYTESNSAKEEKVYENQNVIKVPVVRNGKSATAGFAPEIWQNWK